MPILQSFLKPLQAQFDSLKKTNESLSQKLDSVEHAMNDSIGSLHSQIDSLATNQRTETFMDNPLLGVILCLVVSILLCWIVWKFFLSSRYHKATSSIKKGLILLLVPIMTLLFMLGSWLMLFFWKILVVLLLIGFLWWLYKRHKKSKIMSSEYNSVEERMYNPEDDKSNFSDLHGSKKKLPDLLRPDSPCFAAVATDTRKVKNQDSYCEAYVDKVKARIIAVADGVGSSYKSEEGSKFVAAKAVELVRNAVETDERIIDFDSIFDEIQSGLNSKVETEFAEELASLTPSSFGTTLIVGVDFSDRFVAAYVGNGSIWHVSGFFNTFPSMVCLPWNAVNLLTPDTTMVDGKEALYKIFFYKGEKKHHKPTVLQHSKLSESPGDIFIITTDGIYSSDHAIAAKDEEGDIWIPSTDQFGLFHDALKAYVEGNDEINDETLKQMLVGYLKHINEAKIMNDDTTVGVFISAEAKAHFVEERLKHETD